MFVLFNFNVVKYKRFQVLFIRVGTLDSKCADAGVVRGVELKRMKRCNRPLSGAGSPEAVWKSFRFRPLPNCCGEKSMTRLS